MSGIRHNIVLIGMPGSFKSSAGELIAEELGMMFVDTDELIAYEYAMSISEIFLTFGEEFFRELEGRIIKRVSEYENALIATGGGTVLREANMKRLQASGIAVYLNSTPSAIRHRIKDDSRPLLKNENSLLSLYNERKEIYERYAEITINNDGLTSAETAKAVIAALLEHYKG